MRTPTLTDAVLWVAAHDDPDDIEVESVRKYLTTCLVADIFEVGVYTVAQQIVRLRHRFRGEA